MVVDAVSNEKGVEKDVIFEAIEAALASATRKRYGDDIEVRVAIDRTTGEYETFRRWKVFADDSKELEEPARELRMEDALDVNPSAVIGEYVEQPMPSVEFGRIAAQTAKQVIVQKVREAEREQVVDEYKERAGELVSGIVKRVDRNGAYVDLGSNAEGFIPREDLIPREPIKPQDRIKSLLREVRAEPRGPQLFLTRTSPKFLIELFKIEVPEVGQGLIEILGAARDAGLRAKIAVRSNDNRIDPVGACVGMRGSRVQAVSNELAGERVDIILYDENPAQFVINAMSPAEVTSIVVDEDTHSMDLAVDEEKLSQAIGRGGQNIRLASELTGWQLNVMTESAAEEKTDKEARSLVENFMKELDVDEDVAVDSRAGRLFVARGDRLRAGQRAQRHRGVHAGNRQRAALAGARRADHAGNRDRRGHRSGGAGGGSIGARGHGSRARADAREPRHRDARGPRRAGGGRSRRDRRRTGARGKAHHGCPRTLVRRRAASEVRLGEVDGGSDRLGFCEGTQGTGRSLADSAR